MVFDTEKIRIGLVLFLDKIVLRPEDRYKAENNGIEIVKQEERNGVVRGVLSEDEIT